MKIAIYARKSAFSEKSESVHNQDRMCRDYCTFHFSGENVFLNYTDEDFSGANADRPALKKMMRDVKSGIIDRLVVYQLDRLSRDVRDFSNLYAELESCGVEFVSVKENIDTGSPLGRAMMYICVVFAQMERETISTRVADNMQGLATDGWWTGGVLPRGFTSKRVSSGSKQHTMLVPDPETADELVSIFQKFFDYGKSAKSFASFCRNNGFRYFSGRYNSETQFVRILRAPYGVPACKKVRDYYFSQGATVIGTEEEWDGSHGVMVYGKTNQRGKNYKRNVCSEWRVCVGKHDPFIPVDLWLSVQKMLAPGTQLPQKMKYPTTLLKGVLRCPCGRLMRLGRKKKNEGVSTFYVCGRAASTGLSPDCVSQIFAPILDEKALEVFRRIEQDPDVIQEYTTATAAVDLNVLQKKEREISGLEKKIQNLSSALAINPDSGAGKYIVAEMDSIANSIAEKKMELASLQAEQLDAKAHALQIEKKQKEIARLVHDLDSLTIDEQNRIARSVLKKAVWDGTTLFLTF